MGHRHADVPQYGRVGQVALHPRDRQFRRQVFEYGVRHAEVAFGVLEVDRVYLVRHRRRADFARFDLLFEVFHRNVRPHIAAQVDQDRIDPLEVVEDRGDVVVVLDLRGDLRTFQVQDVVDETVREFDPVDARVSGYVRVEIPGGSAELGRRRNRARQRDLLVQPFDEYANLLAEFRRRGGLPVRMRQQRDLFPLLRQCRELGHQLFDQRIVDVVGRVAQCRRNRRVVDVLRREPEVHELLVRADTELLHFLFYEVFDGFHVVVGRLLDLFDA